MAQKNDLSKPKITPKLEDWKYLFQISNLFRSVSAVRSHTIDHTHEAAIGKITVNQSRIISYIFTNSDKDIGVKSIARNLRVSAAAASQAVERLVEAGLIDRKQDPSDRRAVMISLSNAGKKFLDSIRAESLELMGDIYDEITPTEEEMAVFRKVLAKINNSLEQRWQKIINDEDGTNDATK